VRVVGPGGFVYVYTVMNHDTQTMITYVGPYGDPNKDQSETRLASIRPSCSDSSGDTCRQHFRRLHHRHHHPTSKENLAMPSKLVATQAALDRAAIDQLRIIAAVADP
jgi:hypothetical protein